jgi:hypothetical protein
MSFPQVFIVEHCLASHFRLTCQNEFGDKFLDSSVPDKLTLILSGELLLDTAKTHHQAASDMRKRVNACIVE